MDWPVDTSKVVFIAGGAPQPVIDYDSKRHKADGDGQPLYQVSIVALVEGRNPEVIKVKVPGEPRGVAAQVVVKLVGFTVGYFAMLDEKNRHVAMQLYRAERIEPLAPARGAAASAATAATAAAAS